MIGRVLCIGTGNILTSPKTEWLDGRIYKYVPPGKVVTHYQGDKMVVHGREVYKLAVREENGDPRYGILAIEDFTIEELKHQVLPAEWPPVHEFEHKLILGNERAQGLAQRWSSHGVIKWDNPNYGAVLIASEFPNEEEIKQGQDNRRKYAMARLTEVKRGQILRMQGRSGYKGGYDPSDEAWAKEYSFPLEVSMAMANTPPISAQSPEVDEGRVACPFCAELIMPKALKCRFCSRTFNKLTVEEFLLSETKVEAS